MTPLERDALAEKMRSPKIPEGRQALAATTRTKMEKRGKKSITLPQHSGNHAGNAQRPEQCEAWHESTT